MNYLLSCGFWLADWRSIYRLFFFVNSKLLFIIILLTFTMPALALGDSHNLGSENTSVIPLPERQRVVYHVSESKKVSFVLGNINNHIDGVGGPDRVEIVVVVNGDGHNGIS